MKVNTSYGIALVKKNKNTEDYEILFIKKRSSYSFITFTKGIYFNYTDVKKLFNTMTLSEKLIILSLDFKNIWFNCYLKHPEVTDKKYIKSKKKFDKFFQRGYNIMDLLSETRNTELIWEIPKGYCDPNESNIDSAIREFHEETNIHKSKYKILWDVKPISYVFSDNNITYNYIYYVAIMLDNMYIPRINYTTSNMMTETLDIKFLSLNMIRSINPNFKFLSLMKRIIKIVKNQINSI